MGSHLSQLVLAQRVTPVDRPAAASQRPTAEFKRYAEPRRAACHMSDELENKVLLVLIKTGQIVKIE